MTMLKVDFKPLQGNTAVVKTASEVEKKHSSEVASSVIEALQKVAVLNEDEKNLLQFVKDINPDLTCKYAGCSDANKALTQFSHKAVIGEKVVYSINTAPKTLDDLLVNLASTRTLFRAVKVQTAKADKAAESLTFDAFVASKKLPASVLSIAGVRENLVTDWFDTLRNMQVSEGSIRNLCSKSKIEYVMPTTDKADNTEQADNTDNTEQTDNK